jgi:hypothetical protein
VYIKKTPPGSRVVGVELLESRFIGMEYWNNRSKIEIGPFLSIKLSFILLKIIPFIHYSTIPLFHGGDYRKNAKK